MCDVEVTDGRTWREQYDRMKRWHVRVAESSGVDERRVDDFYAFFTCCFHLKDWLKADITVAQPVGVDAERRLFWSKGLA
jgi:3-phenylpropionate/cinnamic acid dioxygenase small subunit